MTAVLGPPPHDTVERSLLAEGFRKVAGVDEVGRGAWAGPVSVGIVVFSPECPAPDGVRDSKEVPEEDREVLYPLVCRWGLDWSVGHVDADDCDRFGMTAALRLASLRALAGLRSRPDVLLLDGPFDYITDPSQRPAKKNGNGNGNGNGAGSTALAVEVLELPLPVPRRARRPRRPPPVRTIVDGDATSVSIAAASIVAKVTRDRMMREMADSFPAFDFDRNKGYPSPTHKTALAGHGLSSVHRRSWAFVDGMAFR